jgi:hypothetical protein
MDQHRAKIAIEGLPTRTLDSTETVRGLHDVEKALLAQLDGARWIGDSKRFKTLADHLMYVVAARELLEAVMVEKGLPIPGRRTGFSIEDRRRERD